MYEKDISPEKIEKFKQYTGVIVAISNIRTERIESLSCNAYIITLLLAHGLDERIIVQIWGHDQNKTNDIYKNLEIHDIMICYSFDLLDKDKNYCYYFATKSTDIIRLYIDNNNHNFSLFKKNGNIPFLNSVYFEPKYNLSYLFNLKDLLKEEISISFLVNELLTSKSYFFKNKMITYY